MAREAQTQTLRARVWEALEHPDRGEGRWVAALLIPLIMLNVAAVIIGSVREIRADYGDALFAFEVFSVLIFTAEYGLRVWSSAEAGSRWRFVRTPLAIIDLLAILPFYLGALFGVDLRILRLLRLLRLAKLSRYFAALQVLGDVLTKEARSMAAAMIVMACLITIAAALMHHAERVAQPEAFGDIPSAMWWAAVTLTTVGYGDVSPVTAGGRALAVVVMVLGVGMVALPAGMLASGFSDALAERRKRYAEEAGQMADHEERAKLRDQLGLTEEDAAAADVPPRSPKTCPHCGAPLP